ncbi:hypothetical protein DENSPDRAFT_834259 [Dentipellis sp. KUC8613]|nr:hypothetical protein DENSPDRAFT_834259 [Dentipellis sp. KUC8613]
MDAAFADLKAPITDWDESDVQTFFSNLGFPHYESQIREHNLSGDILCIIDADGLKEAGISTVGQRLAILKAVYLAKIAHHIPIEADHYIPPSETEDRLENLSVNRLYELIREQDERLRSLEFENKRLSDTVTSAVEDFHSYRSHSSSRAEDSPIARQPSFKWANYVKSSGSPTKVEMSDSPHPSPHRLEHDVNYHRPSASPYLQQSSANGSTNSPSQASMHPKPVRSESSDNLKSFKVSLEDPAWKVLPAALRKYKINNDDWQNYAMFICYGPPNNRIERCLSYDEKPLLLFQKLKDAQKQPVFMLKHIKDIRSPIAVAQQKQAARKASGDASSASKTKSGSSHSRTLSRPPRLQVHDTSGPPPLLTGVSAQPGWPEVMSPAVESKDRSYDSLDKERNLLSPDRRPGSGDRAGSGDTPKTGVPSTAATVTSEHGEPNTGGLSSSAREIPVSGDISYAVAIYPYMAEQEDEFDVVVGDTFVIISRARGWWVVQRDPTGSGVVDSDSSKQGWVPAGCLLETRVPVATAIAEASAASGSSSQPSSPVSNSRTPILPLHIVSTSFPGYALMDYQKKGDEELDLAKDDTLRVFKRYNHWSYAVKEDGGSRGWVPSWYIGKVTSSSGTPATPNIAAASAANPAATPNLDSDPPHTGHPPQVSPMSSAFPPQARSTTII